LYGRYASALYSAASKEKSLDKVEKELRDFQATIAKDTRLGEFIANPTLKRSLKKDALVSVAKKLNMSPVTGNFLRKYLCSFYSHFSPCIFN
jgi:F-type H+-transporting ATPase subunit O